MQTDASASGAGGFGASISKGLSGIGGAVSSAMSSLKNLSSSLKETGYQFTAAFTVPIVLAGKALTDYVLTNQTQIADLKKVYGDLTMPISQVNSEVAALEKNFELLSEEFGVNLSDVTQIGAAWAQAGVTGAALATSVKTTLTAMSIGDMSATDATTALISIQAQYHASSADLVNILNDLNVVENQTALNTSDLVTGFARAAGAASDSGVDYQHLAALLAALTPAAGSAGAAGNALKTIFSRLLAPTAAAADALKQMGINTDGLNWTNLTAVQRIEQLSTRFEELTGQQKANAAATIASRFQINRFDILMQDVANHLYNVANGLTDQNGKLSYYGIALDDTTNKVQNAKVAAQELSTALSSPASQLSQVGVLLKNTFGDILVSMMPTILAFAGYLRQAAVWFGQLSPLTQKWVFYLLAILAVIGPISFLLASVIKLFTVFGDTIEGVVKVGSAVVGSIVKIGDSLFQLAVKAGSSFLAMITQTGATQAALAAETAAGATAVVAETDIGLAAQVASVATSGVIIAGETATTWAVVDAVTTAGVADVVATVDVGMALIESAPVTAIPLVVAAMVALWAAAIAVAWHFSEEVGIAVALIPVAIVVLGPAMTAAALGLVIAFRGHVVNGIVDAVKDVAEALGALPGIFVSVFTAVVRVVSEAVQQVYELFSYLDPFAHHSPSLVENVTLGMAAVNDQFKTLENVAGPVGFAYSVLSKFGDEIASVVQQTNALGQQSDISALMKVDPGLVPVYQALANQINVLTPLATKLNNAIVQQTAIVNADKVALDALTAQQTIYANQMTADQTAISTYANTQITGQQAMSDAIFNNTQAQKALQLQMMQMQDAVGPIADVQSQLSSLNGTILELQGTQENLRQGGAGSDILGSFDAQIAGAQSQANSLQTTAAAYQALSDQLTALQNQGQELDLENSLDFDGLTRQIQAAASAMTELPFDQIMAGITENQAALATATDNYNTQTIAVNAAQASYDTANDSLTNLTNSYNSVNDAITALNDSLTKLNSLQSAQTSAASAASSAGSGGAGAAGDFPTGDLGSNLSAGNLPGDNTADINSLTAALAKQLQDATSKLDLTKPIKDELNKVKKMWDNFWDMIGRGLATFFVHWPVDIAKGVANLATSFAKEVAKLATSAWNWLYNAGSTAIGGILSGIETGASAVLNYFENLPGNFLAGLQILGPELVTWIGQALSMLGYAIGFGLGTIVKFFIDLPENILNELKALPGQLETAGKAIFNGLLAGIQGVWTAIKYFFSTILPTLKGYFTNAISLLVNVGIDIATGLFNGLTDTLAALWTFTKNIPSMLLTAIEATGKALAWLNGIGQDVVNGLIAGVEAVWKTIVGWIGNLVSGFIKGFKDALGVKSPSTIFAQIGNDVIQGFLNGIIAIWNTVTKWLGGLYSSVTGYFKTAITWLVSAGTDIFTGLLNAGIAEYRLVTNFIGSIYSNIVGYFANAITYLVAAGKAIMTGLLNGIKAAWNDVSSFLGGLATKIKNLKGPLDYDRQLLVPHGNAIMQGLHQGLMEGFEPIKKDLSAMAGQIANTLSPSMNLRFNSGLSTTQIENALMNKSSGGITSSGGTAPQTITFTGDLSFPNITDPSDADAFIKNLQVLAQSGS